MGAFQPGALLALSEAGVPVDALYGTSVGALNAAYLAGRPDLERGRGPARWWADPTMARLLRPAWPAQPRGLAASLRREGAFLDARPLQKLVDQWDVTGFESRKHHAGNHRAEQMRETSIDRPCRDQVSLRCRAALTRPT